MKLIRAIKQHFCRHEFRIADITRTDIKEPERPDKDDFRAWQKWYFKYYNHDFVVKRIWCPCSKCGKGHYADCGLNLKGKIIDTHRTIK